MKKTLLAFSLFTATMVSTVFAAGIGDISLRFCNGTGLDKSLNMSLVGGQTGQICMQFTNSSTEDVPLNVNFVDGTITNDADQKKACRNEGENWQFGQFVAWPTGAIVIPAGWASTQVANIKFPKGKGGQIHGCVTYFANQKNGSNEMFSIMVRRASFIDINLSGEISLGFNFDITDITENLSKNPFIAASYDKKGKLLTLQTSLKNEGTVWEDAIITGTIKNIFGYSKTFIAEKRTIVGEQSSKVNSIIDDLPFYLWAFTVTYEVSHQPQMGDLKETSLPLQTATIFLINRTMVAIAGAFILLVAIIVLLLLKIKGSSKPVHHTTAHKKPSHKK